MANSTTPLQSDLKYDGVNQRDLVALLENMRDLVNQGRTQVTAAKADVATLKVAVDALCKDVANVVTEWNTLTTKLNADAGVTDTNYAAATARTAVTTAAMTQATITAATLSLLKG